MLNMIRAKTVLVFSLASGLLLLTSAGRAADDAPPPPGTLLVLSKTDTTLSIVDPATRKVVASMPSGPDPHEVAVSTDGRTAYVSNYGGGRYNTITIVDLIGRKTLPAIDLGPMHAPHGLMFAGGKLWFTAEAAKVIGSYDPATKKVDWILGTGQNRTHMIYVSEDLKQIITSNVASATMTFIEKAAPRTGPGPGPSQPDWDETVVPVGRGAEGFDISPNGKELWAANAQDGTISIIDLATRKVVQTLEANVRTANRLKFTPDGKLVFVSLLGAPELVILDAATRKEVKRVSIGHGAAGIQMEPLGGTHVYIACTPDSYVVVFDLKTLSVVGRFDAGKQPDGMAWVAPVRTGN